MHTDTIDNTDNTTTTADYDHDAIASALLTSRQRELGACVTRLEIVKVVRFPGDADPKRCTLILACTIHERGRRLRYAALMHVSAYGYGPSFRIPTRILDDVLDGLDAIAEREDA